MKDFYLVLGIHEKASVLDIKTAYKTLALKFHPDKNRAAGAEERFKEIGEAYSIVGDVEKRVLYDQQRSSSNGFYAQNQPPSAGTHAQTHRYWSNPFANFFSKPKPSKPSKPKQTKKEVKKPKGAAKFAKMGKPSAPKKPTAPRKPSAPRKPNI